MTSGKKARQQRRTPPPPVRSSGARQASPKVLAIAAAAILLAAGVAVAAIVLTRDSSSKPSSTTTLPDSGAVIAQFRGIPQHGTTLGSPKAPVQLIEYIDLQCPICRDFETAVMPTIVRRYVRTGKVQVIARPIAFIGPDSVRGRLAALAAAKQNRFFDFAQLLYANQGTENTGWLNDETVASAFASIPGLSASAAESARTSSLISSEADSLDGQASADSVSGTPTVLVGKRGGPFRLVGPGSPSVPVLEAALNRALGQ
jgi:protein-disulfide isomerase